MSEIYICCGLARSGANIGRRLAVGILQPDIRLKLHSRDSVSTLLYIECLQGLRSILSYGISTERIHGTAESQKDSFWDVEPWIGFNVFASFFAFSSRSPTSKTKWSKNILKELYT